MPVLANNNRVFFTIEQQPVGPALRALANQSKIQLLFTPHLVDGKESRKLSGFYSVKQALSHVLSGTGLSYKFIDQNTVVIIVDPSPQPPQPNAKPQQTLTNDDANYSVLEEVIVSSQHRDENLQDIPLAVTVFSRDRMINSGLKESRDVVPSSPNLQWKSIGATTGGNIFLRGIGDNSFQLNQVGAVGVYVDGVSLNSPSVNVFSLLDLERIEVMRGPQNALYGRNTPAGAINYISRKPTLDKNLDASISVTAGRFDERGLQASIGFKINEGAAARIAFQSQQRSEIYHNPTLNRDETDTDKQSARLLLLLQPQPATEFLINVHGGKNRGENRRWKQIGLIDPLNGGRCEASRLRKPGSGCTDIRGFADSADTDEVFSGDPNPREQLDAWGSSLRIDHNNEDLMITSISAYESNRIKRNEDTDSGPFPLFSFYQYADVEQFTEEFRLTSTPNSPREWLAGIFLFSENLYISTATATPLSADPNNGSTGGATVLHQDNDAWSLYGQTSQLIYPETTITVGFRYTEETKKGNNEILQYAASNIPAGIFIDENQFRVQVIDQFGPDEFNEKWQDWGGRIALDQQLNETVMVYGSVARGFKGGGVNIGTRQFGRAFANQNVDPEFLVTYELGVKSTWLEDSLIVNIAAFHNQFDEQQVFQVVNGEPVLTNAAESVVDGLELELYWRPATDWLIEASVGLLDARFKKFDTGDGDDLSGNQLVVAPDYNAHLLVKKQWQLSSGLLGLQTELSRVDDQYYSVDNEPASREDAHSLVNLRAFYAFGEKNHYRITAWGNNILDDVYCTDRVDLRDFGLYQCSLSQPLTYGLSFSAEI